MDHPHSGCKAKCKCTHCATGALVCTQCTCKVCHEGTDTKRLSTRNPNPNPNPPQGSMRIILTQVAGQQASVCIFFR